MALMDEQARQKKQRKRKVKLPVVIYHYLLIVTQLYPNCYE